MIEDVLKAHGLKAKSVTPAQTGLFNQGFYVELAPDHSSALTKSNSVFVRIGPEADRGALFYEVNMMLQEPGIHQLLRASTGLPVADILIFDDSRMVIPNMYMIMECMEGKPFSSAVLSEQQKRGVYRQAGAYLRQLHDNVRGRKYGYLGPHGCMPPQDSWWLAFEIMWGMLAHDILHCEVYNVQEYGKVLDTLQYYRRLFEDNKNASLLHMDVWAQNILVDEQGKITAILDWDRALWGDPEIEFAVLEYCGFENTSFWDGYGFQPERTPQFLIRRKFYHLYEVQKYLVIWKLRRPERANDIGHFKKYCLDLIDQMQSPLISLDDL